MSSYKPLSTSLDTNVKLKGSSNSLYHDPTEYCRFVRALQYLTFARSYIFGVNQQVCSFMYDLKIQHMYALK